MQADIEKTVRRSAYHVIEYEGATNYAVGLALLRIVGAIIRDERSVLTVSVPLQGEYGLSEVSLGVPCIVTQNGAESVIEAKLSSGELDALQASASLLQETLKQLQSNEQHSGK